MFKGKYLFLFLIFILIMSTAYAGSITSLRYDGADHNYTAKDVTLVLNDAKFTPEEGQMPPIILNSRTLVPVREVFEILGGKVDWDANERRVDVTLGSKKISLWIDNPTATVDGQEIALDVPAKIVNSKTMVPARFISEQGGLVVDWDATTYTVSIHYKKTNITGISFATINGVNCMVINADGPITSYKYSSVPKDGSFSLYIDIKNCDFVFDTSNRKFDSGMVLALRFGDQGNDTHRVVLDLKDETDYVVTMSQDRMKLYYALAKEFIVPGEEVKKEEPKVNSGELIEVIDKSGENIVVEEVDNKSGEIVKQEEPVKTEEPVKQEEPVTQIEDSGNTKESGEEDKPSYPIYIQDEEPEEEPEEEIDYDVSITAIKYSTVSKRVKINYEGKIKYNAEFLENPNRLVVDIESAKLDTQGPTEINIKNSVITAIRFSQYTKESVRVVLDLNSKVEHKVYLKSSEMQIDVKESTYKNIKYKKLTSSGQITLQNVDLDDLSLRQDENTFRYYITYNEKDADFGDGVFTVGDSFVKSITTTKGKITILDCGNMTYSAKQSSKNVIITVREAEKVKEKQAYIEEIINSQPSGDESGEKKIDDRLKTRILVDVGHGGADPGACNGEYQEKNLNVKIAQYLYDMLCEREDLIVDINRTEDNDRYFTVQTRLQYALDFDPDFIVSVHINSLANKNYSGTLVLYSNNESESEYGDITSEECARIITNELSNQLGTINRGITKRDDLHILHDTPCPSVLCEVGFISNDAELERLKTKSFQKAAAKAIFDGIEKILKEM
ncbi:MAG: N-acetylmuramoyl-L-alanine amidase [Clostridia bacterium]|nr:N-acetylmuramoyl-L-alanine amidase [Clostridia bacterium]